MKVSPADRQTFATGINDNGTITGNVRKSFSGSEAIIADKRGVRGVGVLAPPLSTTSFGINNSAVIGMIYSSAFSTELAEWSGSNQIVLSGVGADAFGIDDSGTILGINEASLIWNPAFGSAWVVDLITPNSPPVSGLILDSIAANGLMTGQAYYQNVPSAVILTPVSGATKGR